MSQETNAYNLEKQPAIPALGSCDGQATSSNNNPIRNELTSNKISSDKYSYRQSRHSPDSEDDFKPICKPKIHVHNTNSVSSNREALRQIRRRRLLASNAKSGSESRTLSVGSGQTNSGSGQDVPAEGTKPRPKREPLPMHRRALPQSFFKEPKSMNTSSLAGSFYSVLPPLFPSETCEDVTEVRPVTPPNEKVTPHPPKKAYMSTEPDTELLFSLFNHLEDSINPRLIVKRGRPKKQIVEKPPPPPTRGEDDDPCIVDALSERMFPKLSINSQIMKPQANAPLQVGVIRYNNGGKTIEFPAIQNDQNYSAVLNELVTHM